VVRTPFGDSECFQVRVGVHQGSILSPLLFVIVMEAVTRETRRGLPWELLYADDLVLMADSMDELSSKIKKWKDYLEKKGMKVNVGKTKWLVSGEETELKSTSKWPCGVCGKGVSSNSVQCSKCQKWIHHKCSGIKGSISKAGQDFMCKPCKETRHSQSDKAASNGPEVLDLGSGNVLEKVQHFCYLGDTIGSSGGSEHAVLARIRGAWNRFRQLVSVLAARDISLKLRGKLYDSCVRSTMLYGSETWVMKKDTESKLIRNENQMLRWMCGVKLLDKISCRELRSRLGLESIEVVMRRRRLRWFGHVERKEEHWVKRCMELEISGCKPKGRPKKTWWETIQTDMKAVGLRKGDAMDRVRWRSGISRRYSCLGAGSPG